MDLPREFYGWGKGYRVEAKTSQVYTTAAQMTDFLDFELLTKISAIFLIHQSSGTELNLLN